MEGVPIRNARRGDIPSLLLLWEAMMRELVGADERFALHPRAREHRTAELQGWLADESRIVIVAEEAGRLLVGFAVGTVTPGNGWQVPERLGRISDVFVAPARRRRGVARRLAGRLLDLLYEKGVDTVRLSVAVEHEAGHAFWRSMGWSDLEVVLQKDVRDEPPASPGRPA